MTIMFSKARGTLSGGVILAAILSGCGATDVETNDIPSGGPSAVTSPSPSASPSPSPSPKPSPSPSPSPVAPPPPPPPPPPVVEEPEPAEPEAYYKNCSAAKAAGAAPLRRGEPGYRKGLDRDGDGVACET